MQILFVIAWLALGVVQLVASWYGAAWWLGTGWGTALFIALLYFRLEIAFVPLAFLGAYHEWGWAWYWAVAIAAPALLIAVPTFAAAALGDAAASRLSRRRIARDTGD